jgi:succinyl-CoA synthetase alpha subunit
MRNWTHFYVCRYDPDSTAAIILTGKEGGEGEDEAAEVCKEAEINVVVRQSVERDPTQYL